METVPAALPTDWFALAALVFVLGMKHGFDADHLATIDGLTRFNARHHPRLARCCGMLFSCGHGAVVITIALVVATVAGKWQVPAWIDAVGAWISIAFLAALGLINLRAVLQAAPGETVRPLGLKGRLFSRLQRTERPLLIAAVGALFALSFDTMSQAALFALTATQFGGWQDALMLALLFMLGMLVTDGINGLWISRLLRRTDTLAQIASRVMGLVVGGSSLLVAAFGAARFFVPAVDAWSDGKGIVCGMLLLSIVGGSYLYAVRLARRPLLA